MEAPFGAPPPQVRSAREPALRPFGGGDEARFGPVLRFRPHHAPREAPRAPVRRVHPPVPAQDHARPHRYGAPENQRCAHSGAATRRASARYSASGRTTPHARLHARPSAVSTSPSRRKTTRAPRASRKRRSSNLSSAPSDRAVARVVQSAAQSSDPVAT